MEFSRVKKELNLTGKAYAYVVRYNSQFDGTYCQVHVYTVGLHSKGPILSGSALVGRPLWHWQ